MVETGTGDDIYLHPAHPYTDALIKTIPLPDPVAERAKSEVGIRGELPSPIDPPSGCRFRTRCPYARELCASTVPPLVEQNGHATACHFWKEIADSGAAVPDFASMPPNPRLERLQAAFAARGS